MSLKSVWRAGLLATALAAGLAGAPAVASPADEAPASPAPASAGIDLLSEPQFERIAPGAIPRGVVASAAQDRAGFLWLATGDGLVRYDGYRFRPQTLDSADPAQRNLGWIRALLPARDGRLWIGTETTGLAVYNPQTDRVSLVPAGAARQPMPTIMALAEDGDGSLWIGSMGGGLDHFDPASGRLSRHRHGRQAGSLPDDRVVALLVDRLGTLWVGSWQGLSRRSPGSAAFVPVALAGLPPGSRVQALLQTSDGFIWAGTQAGELLRIDPGSGQATRLAAAPTAAETGEVTRLLEAPAGQVWVGRSQGLALHALDGRRHHLLRHDPRRPDGLAANHVTSLVQDTAGWVWVGGFGLGLQRHNPNNLALWVRGPELQPGSPFADADTRSLLALDNGEVWAATPGSGVAVMNRSLQLIGALPLPAASPPAAGRAATPATVQAMAQAGDGTVWLAAGQRLHQVSRARRPLRSLALTMGPARRLLAAPGGMLWIATLDGLYQLAPGAAALERLSLADGQPLAGEVHTLALAPDGALWAGGGAGLFRLARGEHLLQAVTSPAGAALGNPTVIGLLFDREQRLWLDTSVAGLHRMTAWDGRQARFERISQQHGVLGRPFGANLLQDSRGRIWSHMYVYDPAADRLDELTAADGVHFGTGWFQSYAATPDGRLLFGGSKGLLVVSPAAFQASTFAPPLVVSELRINGQPQPVAPLDAALQLTPQHRSFSLEFAALDYSEPQKLRYAYRLKGFDPDWIHTGAEQRSAAYSNLDPGDYRLELRATNRGGQWSRHELALAVQVQPSWWQLGMVKGLAALGLIALLYMLVQWRTRQLRLSKLALQSMVGERTAELEAMTGALQQESVALQESSLTDPLTGLRNRRFFSQHIDDDVALALRRHRGHLLHGEAEPVDADLIFFLVDIDHFKQVNDSHGHAAGDAVLMQMRSRLLQVFRDSDHIVRWGGEEFMVVARGSDRRHAAELAERARAAVADQAFELPDGRRLHRSCSIGFAAFPLAPAVAQQQDWSLAVNCADAALYAVKYGGRDGWLGLVDARAETPAELAALLQLPVQAWWQQPQLTLAYKSSLAVDGDTAAEAAR